MGNPVKRSHCCILRVFLAVSLFALPATEAGAEFPRFAWEKGYNGPYVPDDAHDIVSDPAGNVYVTGSCYGEWTGHDYLTIKYDAQGNQVWRARFTGGIEYEDRATSIALDNDGNVYVAGISTISETLSVHDYVTVKYGPDGEELWAARFNAPGDDVDSPVLLATDVRGHVFVAGVERTLRYDADGAIVWAGPGCSALAVDGMGFLFTTGSEEDQETDEDYVTRAYDDQGNALWTARYDGPAGGRDSPTALTVDGDGNVYVSGFSYGEPGVGGTDRDYATIKYGPGGDERWAARYNGSGNSEDTPSDMAVDADGNVYVTGESLGDVTGKDFVTIKYGPQGVQSWVARYHGPWDGWDRARSLALGSRGDVYVAGISELQRWDGGYALVTLHYDRDGVLLWDASEVTPGKPGNWETAAIAVDEGGIWVAGGLYDDCSTFRYDPEGNLLWRVQQNGPSLEGMGPDYPFAMAVDAEGNTVVAGMSLADGAGFDYATVKYNARGDEQWVARYNGPGGSWDSATSVAMDSLGNAYVSGGSVGDNARSAYATVKYGPEGVALWTARYQGPAGSWDEATSVAVDAEGNVYVAGGSLVDAARDDGVTVKYDPDGNQLWASRTTGLATGRIATRRLVLSALGNVYVGSPSNTEKYDGQGHLLWTVEGGNDLDTDDGDNLVVTGDAATRKYGPDGDLLWERGGGRHVAVDHAGNVCVDTSTRSGYSVAKFDPDGKLLWSFPWDLIGEPRTVSTSFKLDAGGSLYLTGWVTYELYQSSMSYNVTLKLDPGGESVWFLTDRQVLMGPSSVYGPLELPDVRMAIDENRNIFFSLLRTTVKKDADFTTIKYVQSAFGSVCGTLAIEDPTKMHSTQAFLATSCSPVLNLVGLILSVWGFILLLRPRVRSRGRD